MVDDIHIKEELSLKFIKIKMVMTISPTALEEHHSRIQTYLGILNYPTDMQLVTEGPPSIHIFYVHVALYCIICINVLCNIIFQYTMSFSFISPDSIKWLILVIIIEHVRGGPFYCDEDLEAGPLRSQAYTCDGINQVWKY